MHFTTTAMPHSTDIDNDLPSRELRSDPLLSTEVIIIIAVTLIIVVLGTVSFIMGCIWYHRRNYNKKQKKAAEEYEEKGKEAIKDGNEMLANYYLQEASNCNSRIKTCSADSLDQEEEKGEEDDEPPNEPTIRDRQLVKS